MDSALYTPSFEHPDYRVVLIRARFVQHSAWKGTPTDTVDIYFGSGAPLCDYQFQLGVHYLVYAQAYSPMLTATGCSHTGRLSESTTVIKALGPPIWTRPRT